MVTIQGDQTRIEWDAPGSLARYGFTGFRRIAVLRNELASIPAVRGVYAIQRTKVGEPDFVPAGTGGWFRGKDPNVAEAVLRANWVENASVLYIGKAGDPGKSATLRSRLTQYLKFGDDKAVGHWGGRYIWQLADAQELCVAWKPLPDGEPSVVETALIAAFSAHYGRRPFANLRK